MKKEKIQEALLSLSRREADSVFSAYKRFVSCFGGKPFVYSLSNSQKNAIRIIMEYDMDDAMKNNFSFYDNLSEDDVILNISAKGKPSYFGNFKGNVLMF